MAWWFIFSGIILTSYGLSSKIKLYHRYQVELSAVTAEERTMVRPAEEEKIKQIEQIQAKENRLEEISSNLDRIIAEISLKEIKLREVIKDMEIAGSGQNIQQEKFREVLNKTYQEIEETVLPDKYKDILLLDERGLSLEEIAENLDLGIRETELILKLHKREADKSGQ